ncbi:MAG: hypothetical protein SNJ75_13645 [Gemmataceae bacterium]
MHRDTVSAAFKRSVTGEHSNIKFSNSPGKELLPGLLRFSSNDNVLIIHECNEPVQGESLFVQLVDRGRIIYYANFEQQADRADLTWNCYRHVE